jgi:hypothetical protein
MKVVKRILKWTGWLLGFCVLIVIAQMGWGMYREPIAKQEAIDFCATVKLGQPIEGIQERALASGAMRAFAKWTATSDGSRTMAVIYVGMPPFSRHVCTINATNVVESARYGYVD